jgi:hypothetical protein
MNRKYDARRIVCPGCKVLYQNANGKAALLQLKVIP